MESVANSTNLVDTAAAVVGTMANLVPPRIGELWAAQGGVYVGIRRECSGKQYHLVAAIGEHKLVDMTWCPYGTKVKGADSYDDGQVNTAAMADAGSSLAVAIRAIGDGWYLPSQADAHLLASNVGDLLKPEAYWTSTQYSASHAWYQGFGYGGQTITSKDAELRAVAGRRIQIFNA